MPELGRKYLQQIYIIKDDDLKYTKEILYLNNKEIQNPIKMDANYPQTFHCRKEMSGREAYKIW